MQFTIAYYVDVKISTRTRMFDQKQGPSNETLLGLCRGLVLGFASGRGITCATTFAASSDGKQWGKDYQLVHACTYIPASRMSYDVSVHHQSREHGTKCRTTTSFEGEGPAADSMLPKFQNLSKD